MPHFLSVVLFALAAIFAVEARAQPSQTCEVLNQVAGLPEGLIAARLGQVEAQVFDLRLADAERGLWRAHPVLANDPGDIAALWSVVHLVQDAWRTARSHSPVERDPQGGSVPDVQQERVTGIITKFGCLPRGAAGHALLFGLIPMSFAIATAAFFGLGTLLSALGFDRLRRRRRAFRRMCHLPALLRYEGICTVTTVVDIGRDGAKVKAPRGGFATPEVSLHMAGLSVAARVRWQNDMYVGLQFLKTQNEIAIAALLANARGRGSPENLTPDAPPCFKPGCHLACKSHRAARLLNADDAPVGALSPVGHTTEPQARF